MNDTNAVILRYLLEQEAVTDIVDMRIFCPRLPENTTLPAIGFLSVGGRGNAYIPPIGKPSVQFDCWAYSAVKAREVYRALYDALQGIQNQKVTIGVDTYYILLSEEEVHGQDMQDIDIPSYYRVRTVFSITVR